MAFAGVARNEIVALSRLLRGLSVRNHGCDVAKRKFSGLASSVQQKSKFTLLPRPLTLPRSSSGQLFGHQILPAVSVDVPQCQQQRFYAKGAPPQKKPLSFDYSGDLVTQKPLDPEVTHVDFQQFKELDSVDDAVQKLCSIDFQSGWDKKMHRKEEMKERILHLFGEGADREMQVAMLTVDIRNMIPHVLASRKDKRSKSMLIEKIQLRKKILKYLRREDYQRFLWLLQELRIRYVLPPDYYKRITKKYRRKQEVWEAANALRQKKIDELKAQLEAEKAEFLRHKEEALSRLEADARKYDLDMGDFGQKLKRERVGKTYPKILTWEERLQLEDGHPLKPKDV